MARASYFGYDDDLRFVLARPTC